MEQVRASLDKRQVAIYLGAILIGVFASFGVPNAGTLEVAINPALAFMLFVTFLQVPLAELGSALRNTRFLGALLATNFLVMPVLTAILVQFLPDEPMLRLAVLFVLLTPCVDYVVTFTHLRRGDARLLLAATPALLLLQMVLLPVYLRMLLGGDASGLVHPEPFIHAFLWLIAVPLLLAAGLQLWAARSPAGKRISTALGLLPVPATALVLFLVLAAVMPQIGDAAGAALTAAPIYMAYAVVAPMFGWLVARAAGLDDGGTPAVAFSAATRNSLVILPLAFAVPGGVPFVPAVVVTQTIIELVSELVYVRWIPRLPFRPSA
ncbi:arsenic resistance protein [Chelativorans alearense]|uniref:arsenic resistance protein n=1 Tax=Chelativorans alearense TaxID=2681495 RepID=UPI0013D89DE0|nr:arsenic resistance protein [Chelativorans alearense]